MKKKSKFFKIEDKMGVKKPYKPYKDKPYKVNDNDKKVLEQMLLNPEGLRVKSISKNTNLILPTVYKRLKILKENGFVENIFPIWKIVNGQVNFCRKLLESDNLFEIHNLSFVVKLIHKPDWWNKRKNRLMRLRNWQVKNIDFGKGASNPYQQIKNDNWVIQTYPDSVIIIARKRYYGNQPYEVIQDAINDFLNIWDWFEERMRFKFFKDGAPQVFIRNNDYNRIQDHLAKHCKKQNSNFLVQLDKNRKVWVDYSEPFGKESNYPEGQEILEKVTKDHLQKKPMLNSELQMAIQQVTQNQQMFNQNFESHVGAVKQLGNSAEANSKSTELLAETIKELRDEVRTLKQEIHELKK